MSREGQANHFVIQQQNPPRASTFDDQVQSRREGGYPIAVTNDVMFFSKYSENTAIRGGSF